MSRTKRKIIPNDYRDSERLGRDKKPGFKPPKFYKKIKRRQEKAKNKQELLHGKELTKFRTHDVYDYN